jgi:hypothetical protein
MRHGASGIIRLRQWRRDVAIAPRAEAGFDHEHATVVHGFNPPAAAGRSDAHV